MSTVLLVALLSAGGSAESVEQPQSEKLRDRAISSEVLEAVRRAKEEAAKYRERIGARQHVPQRFGFDEEAARARPNLLSYGISAGLQSLSGNGRGTSAYIVTGIDGRWRDWALRTHADFLYGHMRRSSRAKATLAHRGQTWIRGERRIVDDLFAYVTNGVGFDRIAAIELSGYVGAGSTWMVFEQLEAAFVRAALRLDLGVRHLRENRRRFYEGRENLADAALWLVRPALSFRYAPVRTIILSTELEFLLAVPRTPRSRLSASVNASVPLGEGFSIAAHFLFRHNARPVSGVEKTDLATLAGVSWNY